MVSLYKPLILWYGRSGEASYVKDEFDVESESKESSSQLLVLLSYYYGYMNKGFRRFIDGSLLAMNLRR